LVVLKRASKRGKFKIDNSKRSLGSKIVQYTGFYVCAMVHDCVRRKGTGVGNKKRPVRQGNRNEPEGCEEGNKSGIFATFGGGNKDGKGGNQEPKASTNKTWMKRTQVRYARPVFQNGSET